MAARALTNEETAFADEVAQFVAALERLRESALTVDTAGGDAQYAFLSVVPAAERGMVAAQWPIISMMLGI